MVENIFKLLIAINKVTQDLAVAMQDRVLTIDEIYKIVDDGIKSYFGKGFKDIGLKIEKINWEQEQDLKVYLLTEILAYYTRTLNTLLETI